MHVRQCRRPGCCLCRTATVKVRVKTMLSGIYNWRNYGTNKCFFVRVFSRSCYSCLCCTRRFFHPPFIWVSCENIMFIRFLSNSDLSINMNLYIHGKPFTVHSNYSDLTLFDVIIIIHFMLSCISRILWILRFEISSTSSNMHRGRSDIAGMNEGYAA